ncbi:MAG: DNA-processing protein DprA [Candidatus Pseudobacter hemicellulosilyticus]|uniref:DNA-processing protein DprA n=1 Tax=Candidatus Pseudobacter hemicellulosilyticus TaxID=3121375 RepID=A0AAJ5WSD8_9BACT|nr:MAG: DNA-processing protein DprA [Pseudobacter sp.]
MDQELIYRLALPRVPGIGHVHAKTLALHFGSASAIFQASPQALGSLDGIGPARARAILGFRDFTASEKELAFFRRYGVQPLWIRDADYPQRLLDCYDPPTLLFRKGSAALNTERLVAVVGTRQPSVYGRQLTEQLIRALAPYQPTIVSGLALGIDGLAHREALACGLPTIAVLAHGLATCYPGEHAGLAREMIRNGGALLTEFSSRSQPDKHHFPIRNRIVAGMCDAIIVVETGLRGGSMITAELANGYHKEVFTFPGRTIDTRSAGCNLLLRTHKASMLTDGQQLAEQLGWADRPQPPNHPQQELLFPCSDAAATIRRVLQQADSMALDELFSRSGLSSSHAAAAILELELKQAVEVLPGKRYRLA